MDYFAFYAKWASAAVGIVIAIFLLLHLLGDLYFIVSAVGIVACGGVHMYARNLPGADGE